MSRGEKKETVGSPTSIPAVALLPKFADSHSGRLFVYQAVNQSALGFPGAPVTLLGLGFTARPLGESSDAGDVATTTRVCSWPVFSPYAPVSLAPKDELCRTVGRSSPLWSVRHPRAPRTSSCIPSLLQRQCDRTGGASGLASIPRRASGCRLGWDARVFIIAGYTITYQLAYVKRKKTARAASEDSRNILSPQLSCVARNSLLDFASSRTKTGKRRLHCFSYQAHWKKL
jgi:hypothetical protein